MRSTAHKLASSGNLRVLSSMRVANETMKPERPSHRHSGFGSNFQVRVRSRVFSDVVMVLRVVFMTDWWRAIASRVSEFCGV